MGKNKDMHIAVSLKLEKEIYDEAQPEKAKGTTIFMSIICLMN